MGLLERLEASAWCNKVGIHGTSVKVPCKSKTDEGICTFCRLFVATLRNSQVLAKKMTVLYKLSKEQLSKQYHYDFGLRALKSVLVMAGGLKRQYSEMPEDLVLMRALRDSNMPKFVFEDVPLFKGLINDLFPNMDCPRVGYEDLKVEVRKDLESKGFRCSDDQVFADQVSW